MNFLIQKREDCVMFSSTNTRCRIHGYKKGGSVAECLEMLKDFYDCYDVSFMARTPKQKETEKLMEEDYVQILADDNSSVRVKLLDRQAER